MTTAIAYTKPESFISNQLAMELHGQREVQTPAGFIDVLTASELIEVKVLKHWKSALGQLLAYGEYYPSHLLRLHLIGEPSADLEEIIQRTCQRVGAVLTYQNKVLFSDEELAELAAKSHRGSESLKFAFLSMTSNPVELARRMGCSDELIEALVKLEQPSQSANPFCHQEVRLFRYNLLHPDLTAIDIRLLCLLQLAQVKGTLKDLDADSIAASLKIDRNKATKAVGHLWKLGMVKLLPQAHLYPIKHPVDRGLMELFGVDDA